jgi:signal transduction histidine kinase
MDDPVQVGRMKNVLVRSLAFPALVAAGVVVLALGLMLASLGRNLHALAPLEVHLAAIRRIQLQSLDMQYALVRDLRGEESLDPAKLNAQRNALFALSRDPDLLSAQARDAITDAHALFATGTLPPQTVLRDAVTLMHEALAAEARAHDALLKTIAARARQEFRLAAAVLAIIVVAGAVGFVLSRRRILEPLRDLDRLMQRLAQHDFAQVETHRADSLIAPLLGRYNEMVARLAELEAAQAQRQASLEQEVRTASRELIAYNRSLAEAEKLAAVGELAASVAHELRNPLAGVQLAVANLQHDLPAGEPRQRLDAVIGELRRMTGLMNALLDQARHAPETPGPVHLAEACEELLALARYQVAPEVALECDIDRTLVCSLPPDRLRQALLNLVLNAAQAQSGPGRVTLRAACAAGQLLLMVEDAGPGFAEPLLKQGVTHFASARSGGTGLGLATVRRFALDLGGTLALENMQPHGARVSLRLPCPHPD